MYDFSERTALVTGAGTGIGFEIARQLSLAGAAVVLNDIEEDLTQRAVDKLLAEGGKIEGITGDAADLAFIRQMVERAVSVFGQLDTVVANAGITTFGDFLDYSPEQFKQVVALNLQGTFFLAQQAARQMIRQAAGGRILFISSVTGHTYHRELAAYGMSKAAINCLAKYLGVELAAHRITVNAVSPGATLTERTTAEPDYRERWENTTPNGRCATTADIAHAALFLLSEQARHITSQTLIVDGGWTSMSPSPD